MVILAIDPGNIQSGYVLVDENLKVIEKDKVDNEVLLDRLRHQKHLIQHVAIEMIASMGMAVGQSVFDTCVWIGKFEQILAEQDIRVTYIRRSEVKMNLCGSMRAKDSNITQALIDRFAPNTRNKGKGIKSDPGWFYGFKKDIWQAFAVAVTYYDKYIKRIKGV